MLAVDAQRSYGLCILEVIYSNQKPKTMQASPYLVLRLSANQRREVKA